MIPQYVRTAASDTLDRMRSRKRAGVSTQVTDVVVTLVQRPVTTQINVRVLSPISRAFRLLTARPAGYYPPRKQEP